MAEAFGALLKHYRERMRVTVRRQRDYWPSDHIVEVGLSQNELARRASINTAHANRLESGDAHASQQVVLKLAEALLLTPVETDTLLAAAGHCPLSIAQLDADRLDALLRLLAVDTAAEGRRVG